MVPCNAGLHFTSSLPQQPIVAFVDSKGEVFSRKKSITNYKGILKYRANNSVKP
jgi:hypothetical protein